MSDDPNAFDQRRKSRALITAGLLIGLVLLIYFITVTRMAGA
jgi:hypothetical protein